MTRYTISQIQNRVARFYRLPECEMKSARRSKRVSRPRQVAMYLSRELTPQSYPEIGRRFGDRDHTTIMHGCRVIEALSLLDPDLAEDIRLLRTDLQAFNAEERNAMLIAASYLEAA